MLDWTTDYFRDSGFDQPRLDAEVLLAEALDCRRIELYTRFDDEPPEDVKGKFRDWVARHAEGEPVAYLVGHKEFFSLGFAVNSHVLIPRPETEHLVTEALDAIKSLSESDQAGSSSPIHQPLDRPLQMTAGLQPKSFAAVQYRFKGNAENRDKKGARSQV